MKNCEFYKELRALFKRTYEAKMLEYHTTKENLKAQACACDDFDEIKIIIDRYHEIEDRENRLTLYYQGLWLNDSHTRYFKEFAFMVSGEKLFETFHTVEGS